MNGSTRILLFIAFTLFLLGIPVQVEAQPPLPPAVERVFNAMTPEEKVGQLVLVNFQGVDTGTDSQIRDLIARYHVGGIVVMASNDNLAGDPQTTGGVYDLIARLQRIEWEGSNTQLEDPNTGQSIQPRYIPLFIGISQDGNGYPYDQILNGLTPLPSRMAIGATWDPQLAAQVGEVQGRELAALGFNLILGPSLDVLEIPNPAGIGDLGTTVFGGDPYWVAEMGRSYISGLHLGSQNRLLVIAKHFPGRGATNRLSEEEIPTVRKSLEQLKQIELAPFMAVTDTAPGANSTSDGLLVSHIRYQGFQGNIRATTRPISFDPQALDAILELPQFSAWRESGGLMVSDDLGTRAVREFYTSVDVVFSARETARDAFLAGNDLLYLGNITSGQDPSGSYSATVSIINFFTQKYREDPAFAQHVNASVQRILAAKYRLYNSFSIYSVTPPADGLENLGSGSEVVFNVANEAATLASPGLQELTTVMPTPPKYRERLVFITDVVSAAQCSGCAAEEYPSVNEFQRAVIRLYGPEGDNQTSNFLISSYDFKYLQSMLDGLSPPYIEGDIDRADWIILSTSSAGNAKPALVSRFLTESQNLLRDKKVLLFSFGAPYYFDATDISRLTAYYVLYSKQPPFVDIAARLLFQELKPVGASPVSIPGIGYDLISVMSPSPDQVIPLILDIKSLPTPAGAPTTPEPTPVPLYRIGDTIAIRTGVIKDHNGRPVPDGTVVQFSMTLTGEGGGILQQVEGVTAQGIARAAFGLDKPGLLEIHAESEPALVSEVLQLDVTQTGSVAVTVVVPELTQSAEMATPVAPILANDDTFFSTEGYPVFSAWIAIMVLIAFSAWMGYRFGKWLLWPRAGIRWALGILLGGLTAFNYFALGLPGSMQWSGASRMSGIVGMVILGELVGLVIGWLWSRR